MFHKNGIGSVYLTSVESDHVMIEWIACILLLQKAGELLKAIMDRGIFDIGKSKGYITKKNGDREIKLNLYRVFLKNKCFKRETRSGLAVEKGFE